MYDYNLQFADGSRYMILTSPNGYGKTTILNIINSLAKTDLYYFFWLNFRSISLSFVGGAELMVETVDIVPEMEEGMFHTDAHDLETMMLKGGNLSALAVEYSGLTAGIDENALCDALLKYSYLKWYNYNERTKLGFGKLNTVDLFEKGRLNDSVALFTELCNCSSKHQAVYNDYLTFCQNHPIVDIWFVTNGHDLMDCIYSEMHKRKRGNLPKDEVIKSFYKNYSIEMFQQTELYAQLSAWGEQNGRALFVAA